VKGLTDSLRPLLHGLDPTYGVSPPARAFAARLADERQAADGFGGSGITLWVSQQLGIDVLDDGNLTEFIANFAAALNLAAHAGNSVTVNGGSLVIPAATARVYVTASAVTLTLPGNDVLIMDRSGNAATFPITVNAPAGHTINRNPSYIMIGAWASAQFVYDGANYGVR
jgi:hypothetical protein